MTIKKLFAVTALALFPALLGDTSSRNPENITVSRTDDRKDAAFAELVGAGPGGSKTYGTVDCENGTARLETVRPDGKSDVSIHLRNETLRFTGPNGAIDVSMSGFEMAGQETTSGKNRHRTNYFNVLIEAGRITQVASAANQVQGSTQPVEVCDAEGQLNEPNFRRIVEASSIKAPPLRKFHW